MLGLGTDEPDEEDDERIDVKGVPFIAEKDFLLNHGGTYELTLNEDRQMVLKALAGA